MLRALLLTATVLSIAGVARPVRAETLADAIALAYQANPALLASRAELRATDERYVQARAALGPTVSASGEDTHQDSRVTQRSLLGQPQTTHDLADNLTGRLTASQPLYSGGQLSATVSAARAAVMASRQSLRKDESTLLSQVIGAYTDVYLSRDLVEIARQNLEILRLQVAETTAKYQVKEVTYTDQAQANARSLGAEIRLTQARNQLRDAEAKYLALVGQPPGNLSAPPDLPGIPQDVEAAFDAADKANPTYLGAQYVELESRARVREVKAADSFQISLSARLSREPAVSYLPNTRIDAATASLVVTKPLFSSGAQTGRVHEAVETNNRDALRVGDSHRQIVLAVAQAWNDLVSTRSLLTNLQDQLTEERKAFQGSRIEQRVGQRTTIDVLNAEQEYQDTKASLAQRYHDEYLNRVALLSAMGLLQAELIDPQADLYRPEKAFNRAVRFRALPWQALIETIDSVGAPPMTLANTGGRDPLGAQRPGNPVAMPAAPRWDELAKTLAEKPALD